jgi:hypothetical protein
MNKFEKEHYKNIVKFDPKPIGNIILNLCGCKFCEAFGIENCGEDKISCTDYIDDFIRDFLYNKESEAKTDE